MVVPTVTRARMTKRALLRRDDTVNSWSIAKPPLRLCMHYLPILVTAAAAYFNHIFHSILLIDVSAPVGCLRFCESILFN